MKKRLFALLLAALTLCGCAKTAAPPTDTAQSSRMELRYADQFTVELDAEGRALVTIAGSLPAIRMVLRLRPAEVLHGGH